MIKATFIATIREKAPREVSKPVLDEAKAQPGFVSVESEIVDGVETTITVWKTMQDVEAWRDNPVHMAVKRDAAKYYSAWESHFEEV